MRKALDVVMVTFFICIGISLCTLTLGLVAEAILKAEFTQGIFKAEYDDQPCSEELSGEAWCD